MNLHNDYYWFKEAISNEVCDKIIDMGENRLKELRESEGS